MVYSNKFVLCVLINGRPQKELANGAVRIPFGEFSLRFRNKNSRRAMVKIFIDGEDVGGNGYIIPAHSFVDIERWADKPVKFKFVSLDSEEAVDFGKDGPNEDKVKGTIEARFYLEKEVPKVVAPWWYPNTVTIYPSYQSPIWYTSGTYTSGTTYSTGDNIGQHINSLRSSTKGPGGQSCDRSESVRAMNLCCASPTTSYASNACIGSSVPVQDGCTVEGAHSDQSFRTVLFDAETDYVSLKLFLQGFDEGTYVAPVHRRETVKSKKLRELQEENDRLKHQLHQQEQEDADAEALRKLEEENRKLRESLERKL